MKKSNNILDNALSLISPLTANLAAGGFIVTGLGIGSVTGPSLSFTGDVDTGVYSPAANRVALAAAGAVVFDSGGTGSRLWLQVFE